MKTQDIKINSYLSFKMGQEEFALNVNKVLNILEMSNITAVPKAPYYMKGVINHRGMVLPIIDTRLKFCMPEIAYTDKTCIVVMEVWLNEQKVNVGCLVDEVLSVIEIESKDIQEPPSIGCKYKSEFINGMVKVDDKFLMILEMDQVFSLDEFDSLQKNNIKETE